MALDEKRKIRLDLLSDKAPVVEGLRYGTAKNSGLKSASYPTYTPMPPPPKTSSAELAKEAAALSKKVVKLCGEWNDVWEEISLLHDRMYNVDVKLDDVPGRPVVGSEGYGSGRDVQNDLTTVAAWLQLTATQLTDAPKIETSKKK